MARHAQNWRPLAARTTRPACRVFSSWRVLPQEWRLVTYALTLLAASFVLASMAGCGSCQYTRGSSRTSSVRPIRGIRGEDFVMTKFHAAAREAPSTRRSVLALAAAGLTGAGAVALAGNGRSAQAVAAVVGTPGWINVVAYGADPAGVEDSASALQNAVKALPASGGVVYLPAGTYLVSSTVTCTMVPTYFMGDGAWATVVKFTGTGDCFRIYDSTAYGSRTRHSGGFSGIMIDGLGAGAGSAGLHMGDLLQYELDLAVQDFRGAGSIGVHLDNQFYWTEQLHGRIHAQSCASHVVFDCSGSAATASGSFERCDLDVYLDQQDAMFDGVVFRNGAFTGNGSLRIRGNFASSASAVSSAVLRLTGSTPSGRQYPSSAGIQNGLLDIGVECGSGQGTPQTIAFGSAANTIGGCYGALNFGIGGYDNFSASNNSGNVRDFRGPITGDSTLPGQWATYASGLPAGWTGHVSARLMPTGHEVMLSWSFVIAAGTRVSNGLVIATLGSRFLYTDNKVLSGNVNGGGLAGSQYAPAFVAPTGEFQYHGPSFTASSTAWWYGQGIYTLSLG
jgi:Pectate lyase superfamily protein